MAREYTIGIPVATVLFIVLIVLSYRMLFSAMPNEAELRAESVRLVEELRERGASFLPPNNDDPTDVSLFAESQTHTTILHVYGLIDPRLQAELLGIVQSVRDEVLARPIVVLFYYAREVPPPEEGVRSRRPSARDNPEPFRTERVTLSSETNSPQDAP
jgi:hypothetical protein